MNIEHEGEESYDNMWQKSRFIWKFIYSKLASKYDFFLLGGDDMFYIIENLRDFLNSNEIVQMRDDSATTGLFLGRRWDSVTWKRIFTGVLVQCVLLLFHVEWCIRLLALIFFYYIS